jgi:aryl-alcohol dehydrogenase-like predicted oxidoreductase
MITYREWLKKAQDALLCEQADHVPQATLGKTGLRVGKLGWGTGAFHFATRQIPQRDVDLMAGSLLDAGANLLDTAADYPNDAEAKLGRAIKGKRDQYVILTKCGHRAGILRGREWTAPLIKASVDRSLKRLQTDVIDIILLHSADMEILKKGEALGALAEARDKGKVRFIGYSGDNEEAAFAASLPDVSVIETSLNVTEMANVPLFGLIRDKNIGLLAKRSIANACWKPKSRQYPFAWKYGREYKERLKRLPISPTKMGMDGDNDHNWVIMCLLFTLAHPVDVALVGSTVPKHILENIEIIKMKPDQSVVRMLAEIWHDTHENIENYRSGNRWVGLM